MAQVLAECLDIPMQCVRVHHGSTTLLDTGFGAYHSRSAVMSGAATHEAARLMRNTLLARAAQMLGRPEDTLQWRNGCVVDGADGSTLLNLTQLAEGIPEHANAT